MLKSKAKQFLDNYFQDNIMIPNFENPGQDLEFNLQQDLEFNLQQNPEIEENVIAFPVGSVPWLDENNKLRKEYLFLSDVCLNFFKRQIRIDRFGHRTEINIGWVVSKTQEKGNSEQIQVVTNFINELRIKIKEKLKKLKDTSQAINLQIEKLWHHIQLVVKNKYGKDMATENYGILPYERGRIYIVAFMEQGISLVDDEELAELVNELNRERCQEYQK